MLVKRAATDAVRACQVCVEVWAHAKGVYFPVWEYWFGYITYEEDSLKLFFWEGKKAAFDCSFFVQTCNKLLEYFSYLDTIKAILLKREKVK